MSTVGQRTKGTIRIYCYIDSWSRFFFGTPHRGSGSASLSKTCLDIGHVFYPNLRSDLVQNLKRTAEELADIGCSAPELLQPLSIVTPYETRPLELLKLAGIVVGRESALLYLTNEMAIPIDADHRAICRFSDPSNPKFRPVLLAIADAISRSAEIRSPAYKEFLNALYFDGFQRRRLLLPDSYKGTFTWIWTHDRFKEWMNGGSKMLWIQGKPASGKSTMMKFIRHGLAEGPYANNHNHIVVDFFYSIRGSDVEQEHVSMLRSIIWQLISPYRSLWPESLVLLLYKIQATSLPSSISDEPGSMTKWFSNWVSVKNLQSLLLSICRYEIRTPITIYVLVDAMDESELLNRRKIATSLLDLTTNHSESFSCPITIKVLVASRPDPTTEAASDRCIRMNFESQTDQDMRLYIEKSLASLVQQLPSLKHDDWSVIQQTLQRKCQGVFLWVKLILLELEEKYHREGCTIQEMEDILISIPSGLDAMYARMFLVIEAQTVSQRRETEAMLAWTADNPVSHDVMNDIVAIAACSDCGLTRSTLSRNRLGSHAEIEKRVSSRCVNFLEWKRSQDSPAICQFIHATALQFIAAKMSNIEQLLEDQAMKYARFVVDSDPSWLFLTESWPNFKTEQLKRTNLALTIDLFYTLKLPLFGRILVLRNESAKTDLPLRYDIFTNYKPPCVLFVKLYLALLLSAAVQANYVALLSLKLYGYAYMHMMKYYCFDAAISTQDRLYTSFVVRSIRQWFGGDGCSDVSTFFERRTLFCDLTGILSMFTGLEKFDHLAAAAQEPGWLYHVLQKRPICSGFSQLLGKEILLLPVCIL
ncbi:hypothetical protein BKA61DRAFT_88438 [Leptodontidium sp. MPI-SDFR-AT-0119]|nr:hypothetical protein BKA61DRAFT_88438 [Leptodontidium sp. MPI-SDFR-AT-0119]